jgi:hypothetical protein
MRINILVLNGVFDTGLAAVLDAFGTANVPAEMTGISSLRFHTLGKSPLAFFQDLRIERGVHLLRTSDASVDQIAAEVGYSGGVTLRALLRKRLGRSVRDIRRNHR